MFRDLKYRFNRMLAKRQANKERKILDATLYNDCVRLPEDLNYAFFDALKNGNVAKVKDLLQKHPETAKARDYPQNDEDYDATNLRASEFTRTSALVTAVSCMPLDVIETMLDLGADPNVAGKSGYTALYDAASLGKTDVIDALLARGANIDAACDRGSTPVMSALERGKTDTARHLLAKGAKLGNPDDVLSFILASSGRKFMAQGDIRDSVSLLVREYGADINKKDEWGKPLILKAKSAKAMEAVLLAGANPDAQDKDLKTAFHHAAAGRSYNWDDHAKIIGVLGRHNADPRLKDIRGKTPLDILNDCLSLAENDDERPKISSIIKTVEQQIEIRNTADEVARQNREGAKIEQLFVQGHPDKIPVSGKLTVKKPA